MWVSRVFITQPFLIKTYPSFTWSFRAASFGAAEVPAPDLPYNVVFPAARQLLFQQQTGWIQRGILPFRLHVSVSSPNAEMIILHKLFSPERVQARRALPVKQESSSAKPSTFISVLNLRNDAPSKSAPSLFTFESTRGMEGPWRKVLSSRICKMRNCAVGNRHLSHIAWVVGDTKWLPDLKTNISCI